MSKWGSVFLAFVIAMIQGITAYANPTSDNIILHTNSSPGGQAGTIIDDLSQRKKDTWKKKYKSGKSKSDEILVRFSHQSTHTPKGVTENAAIKRLNKKGRISFNKIIQRKGPNIDQALSRWYKITLPKGISLEEAVDLLARDPAVEIIEPNFQFQADALPSDPLYEYLWGMQAIHAPQAWDSETGQWSTVVAVIDSGIDYTHPDIAANMWTNPGEISGNGVDDDGNGFIDDYYGYDFVNDDSYPWDDQFHGTHVAGSIAAVGNNAEGVTGVAWSTRLMAVKFLDHNGSGSLDKAIAAIDYAAAMGARIANNSWGCLGCFSQLLEDTIAAADLLFVAAAGNDSVNNDITPHYPANHNVPNVISVAATGNLDLLANFSNYGSNTIHLAAPGVSILSSATSYLCNLIYEQNGVGCPNPGYYPLPGTSMAAPHVSGAAALMLSVDPGLTTVDLKARLLDSVDPIPALSDKLITGGRLNVFNAISNLTTAPDFTVATSDQVVELNSGTSSAATITITAGTTYSDTINLSLNSPNALLTALLDNNQVTLNYGASNSVNLAISTTAQLPQGYYPIEITATDSIGQSRSRTVTVKANGPYLNIVPDQKPLITPGQTAYVNLAVTSSNGYTGTVDVSAVSMSASIPNLMGQLGNFPDNTVIMFQPNNFAISAGETVNVLMSVQTDATIPSGFEYQVNVQFQDTYTSWIPAIPVGIWKSGVDLVSPEFLINIPDPLNVGHLQVDKISITEQNIGIDSAASHTSTIYLSTDNIIDNSDTVLVNISVPQLNGGGDSYHVHPNFTIPSVPSGTYYIGAISNSLSTVVESDESNNTSLVYEVQVVNGMDLVLTNYMIEAAPLIYPGDQIIINTTVQNQGSVSIMADEFFVGHFLSTDNSITSSDILIGEDRFNAVYFYVENPGVILDPGETQQLTSYITIDGYNMTSDTYYLGSIIDHSLLIDEVNENNNTTLGGSINFAQDVDLYISSLTATNTTVSTGESIEYIVDVTNSGGTPASNIVLNYYLSSDMEIDGTDMPMGTTTIARIEAGQTVTQTHIPTYTTGTVEGTFYMIVAVDKDNKIVEHSETNNIASTALTVANNMDPAVTTVQYNTLFASGNDSVNINYTITNLGTTATTRFSRIYSKIYLSADTVLDGTDPQLLYVNTNEELAPGASADFSETVTLPSSLTSNTVYLLVEVTDGNGNIANNVMAGPGMQTNADIDLQLTNLNVSTPTLNAGGSLMLNVDVSNAGTTAVPVANTSFYLSTDTVQSAGDIYLGDITTNSLTGGSSQSHTGNQLLIPSSVSAGSYYVVAVTDTGNVLPESNETNNSLAHGPVTVNASGIDLTVGSVIPNITTVARGGDVDITTTVQNVGATALNGGYTVKVYASIRNYIDSSASLIGSWSSANTLASGGNETQTNTVSIPGNFNDSFSGGYILVSVDPNNAITETNENNNLSYVYLDMFNDYDLIVTDVSTSDTYAQPGDQIPVSVTISNLGETLVTTSGYPYSDYHVGIYLATDPQMTNVVFMYNWNPMGSGLANGGTFTGNLNVVIPQSTASGTYYIAAGVDSGNERAETNETNNTLTGSQIGVGDIGADLTVNSVSFNPTAAAQSDSVITSMTIQNSGTVTLPAGIRAGVYLSGDSIIDITDRFIGSWTTTAPIAPGTSQSGDAFTIIPSPLTLANYHIGIVVDDNQQIMEANELNNSKAASATLKVTDNAADVDLVVSSVSTTASQLLGGETFVISSAVQNNGPLLVDPGYEVGLYISTDNIIDQSDTKVGSWWTTTALANGTIENRDVMVIVPGNLPGGSYYIGAVVDDDAMTVIESNGANNSLPGNSTITVTVDSDLLATAVSASNNTLTLGSTVTFNSTVANSGNVDLAAGQSIGVYLSADAVVDNSDLLLGSWTTTSVLAIGASQSNSLSITIPAGTPGGTYYLGALADNTQSLLENDETNNAVLATSTVQVSGADLVMTDIQPPSNFTAGDTITIAFTTVNQGDVTVGNQWWGFGVYAALSTDPIISYPEDSVLAGTGFAGTAPGQVRNGSITMTIPSNLPTGTHYIGIYADLDERVIETNESNNVMVVSFDVAGNVDMMADSVFPDVTTTAAGSNILVSSEVSNIGPETVAAGVNTVIYLSLDTVIDATDIALGSWTTAVSLTTNQYETNDSSVTIPADLAAGTYYLGILTDSNEALYETNESNNTAIAISPINITREVDLSLDNMVVSPHGIVAKGASLTLSADLSNLGLSNVASGTEVGVYLSTDNVIDQSDQRIGSLISTTDLANSNGETIITSIPVSGTITDGHYYIGFIADELDQLAEQNEFNNTLTSTFSIEVKTCSSGGVDVDCVTSLPIETSVSALCPEHTFPIYGLYCNYQVQNLNFSAYRLDHATAGGGFAPGTTFTVAHGMNDNTDVVGQAVNSAGELHAVLIKVGDGNFTNFYISDLGEPGLTSNIRAINNQMTAVGETQIDAANPDQREAVWLSQISQTAYVMNALGGSTGISTGAAYDQWQTEYVSGYSTWSDGSPEADGLEHGFVWSYDGGNQNVQVIGTSGEANRATAINDSQLVAGYLLQSGGFTQAYTATGGTINPLPALGGSSEVMALNNNASSKAVGFADDLTGTRHAALWQNGQLYALPSGSNAVNTIARGISDVGDIVGQSNNTAVLWRNGGLYNLNDLIVNNVNVTFTDAIDINRRGRVLVQADNGDYYILIPESN